MSALAGASLLSFLLEYDKIGWKGGEIVEIKNQYAAIVALARLCGVTGEDKEIFDKFWENYQEVLSHPVKSAEVKIQERKF